MADVLYEVTELFERVPEECLSARTSLLAGAKEQLRFNCGLFIDFSRSS